MANELPPPTEAPIEEYPLLVNLQMNNNQIKAFVVDIITGTSLPTGVDGKLVFFKGKLYYYGEDQWKSIDNDHLSVVSSGDGFPGELNNKIFVETDGLEKYVLGNDTDTNKQLYIKNTKKNIKDLKDVVDISRVNANTLWGYDGTNKVFRPVYIDNSLKLSITDTDPSDPLAGTWTLSRAPHSQDYTWAVYGKPEEGEYPGYFVRIYNEDRLVNGVSFKTGVGTCDVQVILAGNPLEFDDGVPTGPIPKATFTTLNVSPTTKVWMITHTKNLWDGAYIDIIVSNVSTDCHNLSVSLWVRST